MVLRSISSEGSIGFAASSLHSQTEALEGHSSQLSPHVWLVQMHVKLLIMNKVAERVARCMPQLQQRVWNVAVAARGTQGLMLFSHA